MQRSYKFKAGIALEALKGEKTLVETVTLHNVLLGSVADWKKDFLENTDIVFAKDKACKDLRDQLKEKDKEQEQLYKQRGKLTAQLEWAKKNLKSMNLNIKKEPVKDDVAELNIKEKCEIMSLNRSSLYYKAKPTDEAYIYIC